MLSFSYQTKVAKVNLIFWGKEKDNPNQNEPAVQQTIIAGLHPFISTQFLKQVHGNKIIECKPTEQKNVFWGEADSAYTMTRGLPIIIRTADCIPILFSCNDLVAGVHAGWRGLDNQILSNSIDFLIKSHSCRMEDFHFYIGPHIRQDSYEVSEDVFSKFNQKYANHKNEQKAMLNLTNIAIDQILSFGFQDSQVNIIHDDTYESESWYSHRAGDKGRNLSLIWLSAIE